MRHNSVVSRYAIPIGILQVNGWSTGPPGFGVSQFLPQNNLFFHGLSSIYFKMNLNLFSTFKIFLKNPVFRVHQTPNAPKIMKI